MKNAVRFITPDDQGRNIRAMFRSTARALIITEITGVVAVFIDGICTSMFLGDEAYAGVSLLKPFTSIILLVCGVLSTGCNILCSRLVAVGKKQEANEIFNLASFLSLLIGLLAVLACLLFPSAILTISGVKLDKYPELNSYVYDYLIGYMAGIPAIMLVQVFGPNLVMDNGKKLFMLSSAALCVTDIAGDLLNVFVFRGGVLGMGLASTAAAAVQLLILLVYFLRKERFFHLSAKTVRFRHVPEIAKNGSSAFVKKFAGTLRDIFINYLNMAIALTAAAIAARGIQSDYMLFLFCVPVGIGRTLITMTGIYYSANDMKGLKNLFSCSMLYGLRLSAVIAAAVFVAAPLLAGLYTDDPEIISLAVFSIHWMCAALLFDMVLTLIQHFYQGTGNLKTANFISFGERFAAPVISAFVLGMLFGSKGVLASIAVGKFLLLLCVFIGPASGAKACRNAGRISCFFRRISAARIPTICTR